MIPAVEFPKVFLIHVGVDLGGADVHVPQHGLDEPQVAPPRSNKWGAKEWRNCIQSLTPSSSLLFVECFSGIDIRYSCLLNILAKLRIIEQGKFACQSMAGCLENSGRS